MPVTVKNVTLYRAEVENKPGALAQVLGPLAGTGADLAVVMGYRYPGHEGRAAIEVYPVTGKKTVTAARTAGLSASSIPTLLVLGDNKPGLGYTISQAIADAGINMSFMVTQVVGSKYSAVMGFETADAARKATSLIKKATAAKKRKS